MSKSLVHLKLFPTLSKHICYAIVLLNLQNTLEIKGEVLFQEEDGFVYKSYQTSAYCKSSYPIQYPENPAELQSLIKLAISSNETIKLIGSRHSTNDIICTEGMPISTSNISYIYLSADGETVTAGSGAQLQDVMNYLRDFGRSLITVPSYGGITIGGALGTGAHGSSLLHPTTLSDQVVGLTIIDGLGRFRKISEDSEDLPAFRVHLGLLGALVDVTLKTVPLFKMTVTNYLESENLLLDGFALKEAQLHPWYQLFWFPNSKSVVVSKGNYTPSDQTNETPGNAHTNFFPNLTPAEIIASRNALEEVQTTKNLQAQYGLEEFVKKSLYMEVVGKPPIFTEEDENGQEQFVNPATGYAYNLMTNRCTDRCPWDNGDKSIFPEEFALAFHVDHFTNMVEKIKSILAKLPAAFITCGIWIRFTKASDGLMAINEGRDSVHIDWVTSMRFDPYNKPRDRIGAYQAMSQILVQELDGRPHWGKNGQYYFTRKILQRRPREQFQKFQETMKQYDPNGVFLNRFGKRVLLQSDQLSVDPKTKSCALMDYCLCSENGDCADHQVCTKFEERYPICENSLSGLVPVNPFP